MRIKISICLILLSTPFITIAQEVRFIVFADPQIAWFKPEVRNIENAGVRAGLKAGFEMDNYFSSNYAFSTGISINGIGGKLRFTESLPVKFEAFTEDVLPGNIVIYRLQYIDVPIGLKFTTREIGYTTIFAKLGFGGHFNIRSQADIPARGIENESLKNEIRFLNMSYHFGAGVHYSLGGQTAAVAGFEYNHKFLNFATSSHFKALLNSLSIRIGLLF